MRLIYSGAPEFFEDQPLSSLSLGGRASSTFVPNMRANNVFSDISLYEAQKQLNQTKGLFLKNTLPITARNVLMFVEKPREVETEFYAAVVNVENQAQPQMEEIPSSIDTPFFAEFHRIDVIRSQTTYKFTGSPHLGQMVYVFDVSFEITTIDLKTLVQQIIQRFENHPLYNVTLDPDDISETTFNMMSKQLGVLEQPKAEVTAGTSPEPIQSQFDLVLHEAGLDNSQLIAEELPSDNYLALWLRRNSDSFTFNREETFEAFKENGYKMLPQDMERVTFTLTWLT